MKLKHKIGRPGYKTSPLPQKGNFGRSKGKKSWANLSDYQYDVDAYEADRNQQLSEMTPEQLENLKYNDTIFTQPTQWNPNKTIEGGTYYYPNSSTRKVSKLDIRALDYPTYTPRTISRDANYEVVNPVDPSLNRAPGESTAVVNIPEVLDFMKGKQKTLFAPVRPAQTTLDAATDSKGNILSIPRYEQQMRTRAKEQAAQKEFDAKSQMLIAKNQ
jgi:hypothetical protein